MGKPAAGAPLGERLRRRIRRAGPMSFRDWMEAALYDPSEGYYCRVDRVRWGRGGDYRTAPERSPLFAATFARFFAKLFVELGSPPRWTILEAGAGSGEFSQRVLKTLRQRHPELFSATRYVIDEISGGGNEQLRARLAPFAERIEFSRMEEIHESISAGIIFSNELLDALPVHWVVMRAGELRELCVGLNGAGEFVLLECELTSKRVADYLERAGIELREGQVVEVNLDAEDWIASAATRLTRGFIISVDYGAEREELLSAPHRHLGTLRAFYRHQLVDNVLARPGEQDLTTTVDWTQIREAGERAGLETIRFERLDQFLLNEGLLQELEAMAREAKGESEILELRTSAREMIMPDGMAASFQVLVQQK